MPRHFAGLDGAATLATAQFQLAARIVADLIAKSATGVIHGAAGTGKTYAVEAALECLDGAMVTTCTLAFPARPTMRLVADELLRALTGTAGPGHRNRFYLTAALTSLLSGPPRLVVVDEAQRLNGDCIELLRHLHDPPGHPVRAAVRRRRRLLGGTVPRADAALPGLPAAAVPAAAAGPGPGADPGLSPHLRRRPRPAARRHRRHLRPRHAAGLGRVHPHRGGAVCRSGPRAGRRGRGRQRLLPARRRHPVTRPAAPQRTVIVASPGDDVVITAHLAAAGGLADGRAVIRPTPGAAGPATLGLDLLVAAGKSPQS